MANSGFLAVDIGNTRIKATFLPDIPENGGASGAGESGLLKENPESAEVRYFGFGDADRMMEWVDALSSRLRLCGAMSAVGAFDPRLAESLRIALGERFLLMTAGTPLPIGIKYGTPDTLGMDRKATACAAAARYPGRMLAVADAGTALTIDIVDRDGTFICGNISPGLQLRLKSLNDHTARLPLLNAGEMPEGFAPEWGDDTRNAIWAGALQGWIDEIVCSFGRAHRIGVRHMIITGGDMPRLRPLISGRLKAEGMTDIVIDYDRHLLAEGMREIYRHHENEI